MKRYDLALEWYGDADAFVVYVRGQLKLHGISHGKLAKRAGYDRSVVSRWLTRNDAVRVRPSFEARIDLDRALDQLINQGGD